MSMINVDEVEHDIRISEFTPLQDSEYPYCLIGFQIKNHYDQLRLRLDSQFVTNDIIHFLHYPEVKPVFLRGIQLKLSGAMSKLTDELEALTLTPTLDKVSYKNILKKYNLTCKYNIDLLSCGMFPVDGECLSTVNNGSELNLLDMYKSLFHNDFVPYFQSIGHISIFILSNKNIANSNNRIAIRDIINMYR